MALQARQQYSQLIKQLFIYGINTISWMMVVYCYYIPTVGMKISGMEITCSQDGMRGTSNMCVSPIDLNLSNSASALMKMSSWAARNQ